MNGISYELFKTMKPSDRIRQIMRLENKYGTRTWEDAIMQYLDEAYMFKLNNSRECENQGEE